MKNLLPIILLAAFALSSCDMMHEDRSDCPYGLYLKFKYDYNLQRADMFDAHVQALRLYIFDEQGHLVKTQTDQNTLEAQPLECPCYSMHITDLPQGRYQLLAVAKTPVGFDEIETPAAMHDLQIHHDRMPTDTIWHGRDLAAWRTGQMQLIELSDNRPTYDTISFVRDTKQILVSLCNINDAQGTDINDYDLKITDHNSHILWDNSLNETLLTTYTPIACWNSDAKASTDQNARADMLPQTAHAQFMTSRLMWHDNPDADAIITITKRDTQETVLQLNLVDLLCRLRNYDDIHRYSPQEFLDRAYDYSIEFFFKEDTLQYANIAVNIGVLSWAKRVQFVEL